MFIVIFFVFGLIFGSFMNCLVFRLKEEKTILGRSFCPKCKQVLGFLDLIPLFSFLFLGAKCRYCRQKISLQYFLAELIMGVLFAGGYWFYLESSIYQGANNLMMLILYLVVTFFLAIIFLFDLKYFLVSDLILYIAIFTILIGKIILKFDILSILLGAVVGFSFFGIQYFLSRGKWIGSGDIFIGVFMGVVLGWPNILVAIFIAYIIGGILGSFLLIFKIKKLVSHLPLGPFLAFATWLVFWGGDFILNWYLSLIKFV